MLLPSVCSIILSFQLELQEHSNQPICAARHWGVASNSRSSDASLFSVDLIDRTATYSIRFDKTCNVIVTVSECCPCALR
jgi:hypothetical protein